MSDNLKNGDRHPLGYIIGSKLPMMLTNEDIYGPEIDTNTLWGKERAGDLTNHINVLANFLNHQTHTTYEGDEAPQIDEETFVKAWLPHFYNGNAGVEDRDESVTLAWINGVAKSPYSAVDVLRNGEVIYRVPPAQGRLKAIGARDRARGMQQLIRNMDDTLARVPHAQDPQLRHMLSQVFNPADPQQDRATFMSQRSLKPLYVLDEIFTYYGYKTILTPELMSFKERILGVENGVKPERNVPESSQPTTVDDDDDDWGLFD